MRILAIDTSCDDTSVAIIEDDKIISNEISSQIQFHKEWGGVVPSLAKRLHSEKIDTVIKRALKRSGITLDKIDALAVTYGPGLAIALEVGINKAKELSKKYSIPLIPINHMEGHIYSVFARNSKGKGNIIKDNFPYLALLVSGNHTELVLMEDHGVYDKIGETLDDAVGEAFDKVSRMLDLGYPGGQIISKFAEKGNETKYLLPIPMKNSKDFNFSYSGLKTAANKLISEVKEKEGLNSSEIYDIAAAFQKSAIEELIIKTQKALDKYRVNGIILAGGVSANLKLRKDLRRLAKSYNIQIYFPLNKKVCTDNAAMIAICAYWKYKKIGNKAFEKEINKLDRNPTLDITD